MGCQQMEETTGWAVEEVCAECCPAGRHWSPTPTSMSDKGGNGQSSSYCAPYSVQYMGWAPGFLVPLTHSFFGKDCSRVPSFMEKHFESFPQPTRRWLSVFPQIPFKNSFWKASWGTLPSTCCLCYQKVLFDYLIAVFVFVCMFVRMLERNMQR